MRPIHAILLTLALSQLAAARSFNCKLAQSARKHAVCNDTELSALDSTMAKEFSRVHKGVPAPFAATILDDQRAWLSGLDTACPAKPPVERAGEVELVSCLVNEYKARVARLQEDEPLDDGHWLITTRKHGNTHPEILTPTSAEQTWNSAVAIQVEKHDHDAAEELASCRQDATDDEGHRAEDMEVDADSQIAAANSHLIAMTFTVFEYCGGAHPNRSSENWEWSLDLNRALGPDDVFRNGSNWQPFVTAEAIRLLLAGDSGQSLWEDKQLSAGVDEAMSSTKEWTLTRDGIDIQFEQYQVGPYSAGMPQVFIRWNDLRPHLNPDWKPELLPVRIPNRNP